MVTAESALPPASGRLPRWIVTHPPDGERYSDVRSILSELHLGTVCREARCPNLSECWSAGAATLMLLGTDCSRRCSFCAVTTKWGRGEVDRSEPARVGEAVSRWGLQYVVLTQVCRDDLSDGGASVIVETIHEIRRRSPGTQVEILSGDLGENFEAIRAVVGARPEVFAHNLETVERLSPSIRDHRAGYRRSLRVLAAAKGGDGARQITKSGVMLGLGESRDELRSAMRDLRAAGVDLLTLGQYLRPTPSHAPVVEYVEPSTFDGYRAMALEEGFAGVESGPLVRSSYHAEALFRAASRGGR